MKSPQPWACRSAQLPQAVAVTTAVGDTITVWVAGQLDGATRGVIFDALHDALDEHAVSQVVIDLTGVDFCDSAGCRALACAYRLATASGVVCRIRNPRPHVKAVLLIAQPSTALACDA
ncbi:STAS domain-containing protein [Actinoplanes sp. NPDC051859]|uniref:STAS domain-containing protein n=1 Tax=Actinoplanes sp. NPDC051859 TaxID=3363909 RepID=UPI003798220F